MYSQHKQKITEFFGEDDHFTLENLKTGNQNNPYDIRSQALEPFFQDILGAKFAPNISTISISTRSNVSYDNYDLSSDFFIDGCLQQEENQFFKNGAQQVCNQMMQLAEEKSKVQLELKKQVIVPQNQNQQQDGYQLAKSSHDETKNIAKNYIKAIFSFILDNNQYLQKLFNSLTHNEKSDEQVRSLREHVKTQKKIKKYTIGRLKTLWTDEKHGKVMRIISNQFLRKRCLGYISGSKIQKKIHHIRYRQKFIRAVENPMQFTNIK